MSYSHAAITAFLYAGALAEHDKLHAASLKDRGIAIDLWDDWEGHRGFVHYAEPLARLIADHLNDTQFAEVFHDGVVEYELIEPLGEWLLTNPTEADKAFDKFKTDYAAWLTKE